MARVGPKLGPPPGTGSANVSYGQKGIAMSRMAWRGNMKIIGILMAGMLLAAQAFAQDRPAPAATPNAQDVAHYGWADVLRVDPVFEEIAQAGDAAPAAQSHEECYEEQVLEEPAGQSD